MQYVILIKDLDKKFILVWKIAWPVDNTVQYRYVWE
jgi:hypothetical protein